MEGITFGFFFIILVALYKIIIYKLESFILGIPGGGGGPKPGGGGGSGASKSGGGGGGGVSKSEGGGSNFVISESCELSADIVSVKKYNNKYVK